MLRSRLEASQSTPLRAWNDGDASVSGARSPRGRRIATAAKEAAAAVGARSSRRSPRRAMGPPGNSPPRPVLCLKARAEVEDQSRETPRRVVLSARADLSPERDDRRWSSSSHHEDSASDASAQDSDRADERERPRHRTSRRSADAAAGDAHMRKRRRRRRRGETGRPRKHARRRTGEQEAAEGTRSPAQRHKDHSSPEAASGDESQSAASEALERRKVPPLESAVAPTKDNLLDEFYKERPMTSGERLADEEKPRADTERYQMRGVVSEASSCDDASQSNGRCRASGSAPQSEAERSPIPRMVSRSRSRDDEHSRPESEDKEAPEDAENEEAPQDSANSAQSSPAGSAASRQERNGAHGELSDERSVREEQGGEEPEGFEAKKEVVKTSTGKSKKSREPGAPRRRRRKDEKRAKQRNEPVPHKKRKKVKGCAESRKRVKAANGLNSLKGAAEEKVPDKQEEAQKRKAARKVVRTYRSLILDLYQRCNPSKISEVDALMEKYKGAEAEMYERICKKYGQAPQSLEAAGPKNGEVKHAASTSDGAGKGFAKKASAPPPPKSVPKAKAAPLIAPSGPPLPAPTAAELFAAVEKSLLETRQEDHALSASGGWPFENVDFEENSSESSCSEEEFGIHRPPVAPSSWYWPVEAGPIDLPPGCWHRAEMQRPPQTLPAAAPTPGLRARAAELTKNQELEPELASLLYPKPVSSSSAVAPETTSKAAGAPPRSATAQDLLPGAPSLSSIYADLLLPSGGSTSRPSSNGPPPTARAPPPPPPPLGARPWTPPGAPIQLDMFLGEWRDSIGNSVQVNWARPGSLERGGGQLDVLLSRPGRGREPIKLNIKQLMDGQFVCGHYNLDLEKTGEYRIVWLDTRSHRNSVWERP